VHRIGRTGRAGSQGSAISITTPADAQRICAIEDQLTHSIVWGNSNELDNNQTTPLLPDMITLCLASGKKDKIRPGDILGALTKDAGIAGNMIGKIDITACQSYVAIHRSQADKAYNYLQNGTLKGRKTSVRRL